MKANSERLGRSWEPGCQTRTIHVRQLMVLIYAFFTLLLGSFVSTPAFAQFRDPIGPYSETQADSGSPETPGDDPSGIQSRGVSPGRQGVIVQDDQLRAAPGYVLEKGPYNQMTAKQKAGGGPSMSLNCGCVQGTGNCFPNVSNTGFGAPPGPTDVAVCAKSPNGPCSGQCGWTWAPTKAEPPRGR